MLWTWQCSPKQETFDQYTTQRPTKQITSSANHPFVSNCHVFPLGSKTLRYDAMMKLHTTCIRSMWGNVRLSLVLKFSDQNADGNGVLWMSLLKFLLTIFILWVRFVMLNDYVFQRKIFLLKFCIFYTLDEFVPLDCTSDFYIPSRSLRKNRNISWPNYNKGEQFRRISYLQPSTRPFLTHPTADYVIWNSGLCSSSVLFRKCYCQLTTKFIAWKTANVLADYP